MIEGKYRKYPRIKYVTLVTLLELKTHSNNEPSATSIIQGLIFIDFEAPDTITQRNQKSLAYNIIRCSNKLAI